jgi:iron complex transport system ATP-binding protein
VGQRPSDEQALLHIQHATVVKGENQRVLNDISITIQEGEHTVILGPNGSGKSSLIKMIMRQDYPLVHADGTPAMLVYGRARWDVFALRALLGIVSADMQQQFTNGFVHQDVYGLDAVVSGFFASTGLFPHQQVTAAMRQRGMEALARMEATHLAGKPIAAMSTGEARRLLIARALVSHPRALLLDEPTTGLDLLVRQRFLESLRALAHSGTTLLLVTHHIEEVLPEIERVILLKEGRVFLDGPKAEVLHSQHLTALYDAPIHIQQDTAGYYTATIEDDSSAAIEARLETQVDAIKG